MKEGPLFILILYAIVFLVACEKEEVSTTPHQEPEVLTEKIAIIEDVVNGVPVILAGSPGKDFIVAFDRIFRGEMLQFSPVQERFPVILTDQKGNMWDVFGIAAEGPDKGAQLTDVNSGRGYWFTFGAMYPGVAIYPGDDLRIQVLADTMSGWAIATEVVIQGTGLDDIPAIDNPQVIAYSPKNDNPEDGFYVKDDELIIAVERNGEVRAYPHKILDWHEVINDVIGGIPVTITYCPLTGTAKVWERPGEPALYGVSGLLYNGNLIPFDRETVSLWHQLEGRSIYGPRLGETLTLIPHIETTWGIWKLAGQNPLIMTDETGIERDYDQFLYGDYKENEEIFYPLVYDDNRLHRKERVFSIIIDGEATVYRMKSFE